MRSHTFFLSAISLV